MLTTERFREITARMRQASKQAHIATEQEAEEHNLMVRSIGRPEKQIKAGDLVYPIRTEGQLRTMLASGVAFVDCGGEE